MTIPVSSVVGVSIAITPGVIQIGNVSTAMVVTAETGVLTSAQRSRKYQSLAGVGADWATTTEAYKAALVHYAQTPHATNFMIGQRFPSGATASMLGGSATVESNVATWAAISDGAFKITLNGDEQTISAINFTTPVSSMAEVATAIQTAIRAIVTGGFANATVTYDGSNFIVTSGTVGATSTISAFISSPASGTDLSVMMGCDEANVSSSTNGFAAETVAASMQALEAFDGSFFGFGFTKEVRDDFAVNGNIGIEDAALFAEATGRIFATVSNDLDCKNSGAGTWGLDGLLDQYNYTSGKFSSFPSEYMDFAVMSNEFAVDFDAPDSTKTMKFKQLAGITPENVSEGELLTLQSRRINTYYRVGGNPMYGESYMMSSIFLDDAHNLAWLKNEIETEQFAAFYAAGKVPLNNKGGAAQEQKLIDVLSKANTNGMTGAGTTQAGEFLANGYKTSAQDANTISAGDKTGRVGTALAFLIILTGAMHSIEVSGTSE